MRKEETLFQLTVLNPWFWVFMGIIGFIFYTAVRPEKGHKHPDDDNPRRSTKETDEELEKKLKELEENEKSRTP